MYYYIIFVSFFKFALWLGKKKVKAQHSSKTSDRILKLHSLFVKSKQTISQPSSNTLNNHVSQENDFLTYDDLVSTHSSNFATSVSNTNMCDGYYDIPMTGYKFSLKNHKTSSSCLNVDVDYSLNADEIHSRLKVYNRLKKLNFPLGLNIVVERLPRFQSQYPMYNFACSKLFRRDQYASHCLNIHCDIYPHLNDWMIQRCPLAAYGCPYSQVRFKPKGRTVCLSKTFGCFTSVQDNQTNIENFSNQNCMQGISILDLPEEVIEYLFTFLDGLSLNAIAKTCSSLKNVCYNLLDTKGIIVSCWSKQKFSSPFVKSSWREDDKVCLPTNY